MMTLGIGSMTYLHLHSALVQLKSSKPKLNVSCLSYTAFWLFYRLLFPSSVKLKLLSVAKIAIYTLLLTRNPVTLPSNS